LDALSKKGLFGKILWRMKKTAACSCAKHLQNAEFCVQVPKDEMQVF
jgi:hypothetical protein